MTRTRAGRAVVGMVMVLLGALWLTQEQWAPSLLEWARQPSSQLIYPRLGYYLTRYPDSYLIERAGQLPLRVMVGLVLIWVLNRGLQSLPKASFSPSTLRGMAWGHCLLTIYYVFDLIIDRPIHQIEGAGLQAQLTWSAWVLPVSTPDAWVYGGGVAASLIMVATLSSSRWALSIVTGFILLASVESLHYSVAHVEHTFFSWRWVGVIMAALSLSDWTATRGMSLIWWVLGACYGLAGIEKLLTDPGHWLGTPGGWAEGYLPLPGLGAWLAPGVLLWQLAGLGLPWYRPWLRLSWALGGVAFHMGVFWVTGIGGWATPWIATLVWVLLSQGYETRVFLPMTERRQN